MLFGLGQINACIANMKYTYSVLCGFAKPCYPYTALSCWGCPLCWLYTRIGLGLAVCGHCYGRVTRTPRQTSRAGPVYWLYTWMSWDWQFMVTAMVMCTPLLKGQVAYDTLRHCLWCGVHHFPLNRVGITAVWGPPFSS
jgi:hypothetical protein